MISINAIRYAAGHLLDVAFPAPSENHAEISLENGSVLLSTSCFTVRIPLFNDAQFASFMQGNAKFSLAPNYMNTYEIPFFFAESLDVTIESDSNHICFPADIITPTFVLLSRLEEFSSNPANFDSHGRYVFNGSIADRYNIIEVPLADEYAMLIRKAVLENVPTHKVAQRESSVLQTHDIDILVRFSGRFQAMRSIFGRDLLINKSLRDTKKSFSEFRSWLSNKENDPYVKQIFSFLDIAKRNGRTPFFFFKAQESDETDSTYSITDGYCRDIIGKVHASGAVIGLHGSYSSAVDGNLLATEKKRLDNVLNTSVTSLRQHYLRTRFTGQMNSVEHWKQAGITDDYTLGYAERCGFKCGTAHPFRIFDIVNDCETNITEHPLIVMDGTLFDYMKLSENDANTLIRKLLQRTKDVEGDFVLLWHNHTTGRNYSDYYQKVFLKNFDILTK